MSTIVPAVIAAASSHCCSPRSLADASSSFGPSLSTQAPPVVVVSVPPLLPLPEEPVVSVAELSVPLESGDVVVSVVVSVVIVVVIVSLIEPDIESVIDIVVVSVSDIDDVIVTLVVAEASVELELLPESPLVALSSAFPQATNVIAKKIVQVKRMVKLLSPPA
jgi:hypothetical protein